MFIVYGIGGLVLPLTLLFVWLTPAAAPEHRSRAAWHLIAVSRPDCYFTFGIVT